MFPGDRCMCDDECDAECDCECHDDEFDADELGEDPELDGEREADLLTRAAELLLRRPLYPGEIVRD